MPRFWGYAFVLSDQSRSLSDLIVEDGYLFMCIRLCILLALVCDFLVWVLYAGGIVEHFGRDKTIALVKDLFHWRSLKKDVVRIVDQCRTCQLTKQRKQNADLYFAFASSSRSMVRHEHGFRA